ncbi:MAG: glycosyl transferase [Bacteroidia bacterium]|nr:glycosyl transferase [Bacteroidia bacterium]
MKQVFCTLFNSFYLPRGLLLYRSLENTGTDFHLYIFAFDDKAFQLLKKLNLRFATIISLQDFEDDKLKTVKPDRTLAEYCWTCTPATIVYVIEKFNEPACTYLDADMYFYQNPEVLFEEMGSNSVLLTEHRFPPKFNRSTLAGRFCVQFITFKNNSEGLNALYWWRDRCLEWCYNRYEDGKFGDQKYLDDWETRFESVHVLKHLGGGLAPWNAEQYSVVNRSGNKIFLSEKSSEKKFEAVFYHFHHVRFFKGGLVDLGWRYPGKSIIIQIYAPYILELMQTEAELKKLDSTFKIPVPEYTLIKHEGLKDTLKFWYKKIFRYNLFRTENIIIRYLKSQKQIY